VKISPDISNCNLHTESAPAMSVPSPSSYVKMKQFIALRTKRISVILSTQSVPRCKHSACHLCVNDSFYCTISLFQPIITACVVSLKSYTIYYILMFVPCIAGLCIENQHSKLVFVNVFITNAAPTCFGTYVPSSGSVFVLVST
jgi:hypothetical protein